MKSINNFCDHEFLVFDNDGILKSVYKEETNRNFFQSNPKSIYGIKQRIKSKRYNSEIVLPTLLKFGICLILIVVMLNI